jgi:hypothetical protein
MSEEMRETDGRDEFFCCVTSFSHLLTWRFCRSGCPLLLETVYRVRLVPFSVFLTCIPPAKLPTTRF